jgi:hypothetical protein
VPAPKRRAPQNTAYLAGAMIAASTTALFGAGQLQNVRTPGPFNTGHDRLACESCHQDAPGTLRQQLQANARWLFGFEHERAELGALPVQNVSCTECHEHQDDRHPAFRFLEPRFEDAREAIAPHRCVSCHQEHSGRRVTAELDFCRHCHADLSVVSDPIDYPHARIAGDGAWETCLSCHDFHGGRARVTPKRLGDAIPTEEIESYFEGGPR